MGSFFNAILIIICGWAFAGILFLFIYRNLFFTRRKKILDILKNGLFCYGRVLELIHEGFKTYIKVKLLDVENSNSSIVTISPFYANYKRPKIGDCAFVYYMHSDLTKAVLYSFLSGDKDYELLLKQAENIFYLQEKGCSY
ncbi:MAG: hypothetical protein FWC47_08180, partial [Oscillospiraceae bacterium]|nr:hypothetical protein [Oscillospiraceae bacterium]